MIALSDLKHPVELFINCKDLKNHHFVGKTDLKVRVLIRKDNLWVSIGETERLKGNLNPTFKQTVIADHIFEEVQPLRFEIFDVNSQEQHELIGTSESTLGELMGAVKQTLSLAVYSRTKEYSGTLIVRADKNENPLYVIYWQWTGINLINLGGCMGKSSPFMRVLKKKAGSWFQVFETEVAPKNLNPVWPLFKIGDDKLCDGHHNEPFRVECWDSRPNGKHVLIGGFETTLEKVKSGERAFTLVNPAKIKSTGSMRLLSFTIEQRPSFVDYIRGGLELHSIIAIDYTASNKDSKDAGSLHAKPANGGFNEYQQAIFDVSQIVLNYDHDKMIPVYGFGAKPQFEEISSRQVSHCFPCSGIPGKPNVHGIDGVMNVYQFALEHVELLGPTHFVPILTEAMKIAQDHKTRDTDIYHVFLIITDGVINDMKETINLIVESANLPLSVVIVGLGTGDFTQMEILDDHHKLMSNKGKMCPRDYVQFVRFAKFKNDMHALTKEVLAEIPEQVVDYYVIADKKPKPPKYATNFP